MILGHVSEDAGTVTLLSKGVRHGHRRAKILVVDGCGRAGLGGMRRGYARCGTNLKTNDSRYGVGRGAERRRELGHAGYHRSSERCRELDHASYDRSADGRLQLAAYSCSR
jgi:hypothetical protein